MERGKIMVYANDIAIVAMKGDVMKEMEESNYRGKDISGG